MATAQTMTHIAEAVMSYPVFFGASLIRAEVRSAGHCI